MNILNTTAAGLEGVEIAGEVQDVVVADVCDECGGTACKKCLVRTIEAQSALYLLPSSLTQEGVRALVVSSRLQMALSVLTVIEDFSEN